jgi:hypothetical protein
MAKKLDSRQEAWTGNNNNTRSALIQVESPDVENVPVPQGSEEKKNPELFESPQ